MRSKPLALAAKIAVSVALVAVLARRYGGDPAFRSALGRLDQIGRASCRERV